MKPELREAYEKLSLNSKRNEFSNLLIVLGEVLKNTEEKIGIESQLTIKNYDINKAELTEEELLTFFYEDLYNIKRELLMIYNSLNK